MCFELIDVALCVLDDGVTVTVTVGPLLQSEAPCSARGAAAASPNRQERKIFECILSKNREYNECVKDSVSEDSDSRNQKSRE